MRVATAPAPAPAPASAPAPTAPGVATAPVPPAPGADPEVAVPLDHAATGPAAVPLGAPVTGPAPGPADAPAPGLVIVPVPRRRCPLPVPAAPRSRPGRRRSDAGAGPGARSAGVSRRNDGRGPAPKKAGIPKKTAKQPEQQGHSARAKRTRQPVEMGPRTSSFGFRHRTGNIVMFLVLAVAAAQLFSLQVPRAAGLRAEAAGQLKVTDVQKAVRGAIVDRNFNKLAFTIEARALTFQPIRIRKQLAEAREKSAKAPDPQQRLRDIAREVSTRLDNRPDMATVLKKLQERRHLRLPGPRGRPRRRGRDHGQVPRGRRRASGPAPVPRRVVGGQRGRRHRLGRPRAARARGLAGLLAGRHRRVDHLRPRLRRRGDPRQLPQPPRCGQRVHGAS